MKKSLVLFFIFLITMGCVSTNNLKTNYDTLKIALLIPDQSDPKSWWPDYEDVLNYYGTPDETNITKYGYTISYNNISGCQKLLVFFERDGSSHEKKLPSKIIFKNIDNKNLVILGDSGKQVFSEFSYSVYTNTKSHKIYSCVHSGFAPPLIVTENMLGKRSVEISWE